jgi:hypothetical protein
MKWRRNWIRKKLKNLDGMKFHPHILDLKIYKARYLGAILMEDAVPEEPPLRSCGWQGAFQSTRA